VNGSYNVAQTYIDNNGSVTFTTPNVTTGSLNESSGYGNFGSDNLTLNSLSLSGGTLTGSGTLTVTGQTLWSGGGMSGTGVTDMQGGLSLDFNNGQNVFLDTRTLKNEATATVTDNNYTLYVSDGAGNRQRGGATWDFQNDASIQQQAAP